MLKILRTIIRYTIIFSYIISLKFFLTLYWNPKLLLQRLFEKEKALRVLHIWNVAGVSNTLVYELRKLNVQADIIVRKDLDIFHFCKVHEECFIKKPTSFLKFFITTVSLSKKYDILHIHGYDWIISFLRFVYRRKILVLHYHGSEIRYRNEEKKEKFKHADFIAVSTHDLLEHISATYMPNPVDLDLFTRINKAHNKTALVIQAYEKFSKTKELSMKEAEKRKLNLAVLIRQRHLIPYNLFPRFLELFEFYIDIRQEPTKEKILDTLSLTALQALALGVKVIFKDKIIEELPEEHHPEKVTSKWMEIYHSLIKK